MIFSIPKDGLLDRLQAIFRLRCTVMVRIRVKVSSSVNGVRVKVRVSVNMVTVRMGMENSARHVYLSIPDGK